jgi:hypothetical protein
MKRPVVIGVFLLLILCPLYCQQRVSLRNTHERLLCVVPMMGRGTEDDPRRPMFAPLPGARGEAPTRDGIIAFNYQESDDGRYALVEFVALDQTAFAPILEEKDRRVDLKVFVKGKDRRDDVETEFRKFKRNFDIERFRVNVP